MRFLLDENQSPRLAEYLSYAGHDAVHVRDRGLKSASDTEVLESAREDERIVLSADTDFGELLMQTNVPDPSVLLLRRQGHRRARQLADLILANLDGVADDLQTGAIVVLDNDRIRVRRLPFQPD